MYYFEDSGEIVKNPPDPFHPSRDALQYGGKGERSSTTPHPDYD
jgi:hypothetical protein